VHTLLARILGEVFFFKMLLLREEKSLYYQVFENEYEEDYYENFLIF
jgi:hypothetical protein